MGRWVLTVKGSFRGRNGVFSEGAYEGTMYITPNP